MSIVATIALPLFNAKNIAWLALEGLCRQEFHKDWELIIIEDGPLETRLGEADIMTEYQERLLAAGCVNIKYIGLANRVFLPLKWQAAGQAAAKTSEVFLLQGCDDMSHPKRLAISYDAIVKEDCDWYDNSVGWFYDISTKRSMMYVGHEYTTCPNIAFKTKFSRNIPDTEVKRSVDGFLFNHVKSQVDEIRMFRDRNLHLGGCYTDGHNTISLHRREIYKQPKPPFQKSEIDIKSIGLPESVKDRLLSMYLDNPNRENEVWRRKNAKIIASIATMPGREDCLKEAIKSLENQVDEVIVYDNAKRRNLTDKGKFYALNHLEEHCLYLSCDDDLIYPPDYVQKVIEGLERHPGSVVTFHGRVLNRNGTDYYTSHRVFRCLYNVTRDIRVDVAGTGVTAFYTKDFNPRDLHLSPHNRMADLVFSLEAAKNGIAIFCLQHPGNWIKHADIDLSQTIYYQDRHDCTVHNKLANEIYALIHRDRTIRNRERGTRRR